MAYAHQLMLEVGSETGVIGLVGLLAFFVIFMRSGRQLKIEDSLTWAALQAL